MVKNQYLEKIQYRLNNYDEKIWKVIQDLNQNNQLMQVPWPNHDGTIFLIIKIKQMC